MNKTLAQLSAAALMLLPLSGAAADFDMKNLDGDWRDCIQPIAVNIKNGVVTITKNEYSAEDLKGHPERQLVQPGFVAAKITGTYVNSRGDTVFTGDCWNQDGFGHSTFGACEWIGETSQEPGVPNKLGVGYFHRNANPQFSTIYIAGTPSLSLSPVCNR